MRPQTSEVNVPQGQLFKTRLESFLNLHHPFVELSKRMDWDFFDGEFGSTFTDKGRPGLPTRLMVALTYLKHTYNLSDEVLVEQFLENGYWQYFAGFEYFQHEFPCDSSSLTRWRKRMGEDGCRKLLSETLRLAHASRQLKTSHIAEVIVDTTVQEKNITFPTDAKLLHRARIKLVQAAQARDIALRQSYARVGKVWMFKQSKYAHAKQYKRSKKAVRKLRTYLGRVLRDIERKCPTPDDQLQSLLILTQRLLDQKKDSHHKLYSLHEPHVDCISKGKAHKPYEFGCKSSIVTAARSTWVLGVKSFHGNPYDGSTLKAALTNTEENTGIVITRAFADKGYRGKKHWPEHKHILISGRKKLKPFLQKLLKRRSAIEPIIGHLKHDHRLHRNLLKGMHGDHINAILAGAAFNFRKLLKTCNNFLDFIFYRLLGLMLESKLLVPQQI